MRDTHAWIFQATPQTLDLSAELRVGDSLVWSVSRYGRDLRRGDRVYYWQAGRDAGIYGLGRIDMVSARGPDGRYSVQTVHERPLFAPLPRAALRLDADLGRLAVLRQPRGTVFPLTSAEDLALARRFGGRTLTLVTSASRRASGRLRLARSVDAHVAARVEEALGQGDEVTAIFVEDCRVSTYARIGGSRRRRGGDLDLTLETLEVAVVPALDAATLARAEGGELVLVPDAPLPRVERAAGELVAAPSVPSVASPVAESPASYRPLIFSPSIEAVRGALELPEEIAAQLVAAVNAGQHILLLGLPGTGKTTLALNLARAAHAAGLCGVPLLATATADWTTFDTIGGLVPQPDGTLGFAEGVALRAMREDRWLVLDELNRADIDKAFGALLTVLAGAAVDLPTVSIDGRPIRVEPTPGRSGLATDGATYQAGATWRIIATMNSRDRAALFSFSLAFARRFAFVVVPLPAPEAMMRLIRGRVALDADGYAVLERVVRAAPQPLGPAVLLDAARYAATRGGADGLVEAIGAFVLPQLEGADRRDLAAFAEDVGTALAGDARARLLRYAEALHGEA